jgi:hypothetical protein
MIVFELFCIANNTSNQDFLIKNKRNIYRRRYIWHTIPK